jgi:hypothetical protein
MTLSLAIWLLIFACCLVAGLLAWAMVKVAKTADQDAGIEPMEHPEPPPARTYVLADFIKTKGE